jgi:hypothetical protein
MAVVGTGDSSLKKTAVRFSDGFGKARGSPKRCTKQAKGPRSIPFTEADVFQKSLALELFHEAV